MLDNGLVDLHPGLLERVQAVLGDHHARILNHARLERIVSYNFYVSRARLGAHVGLLGRERREGRRPRVLHVHGVLVQVRRVDLNGSHARIYHVSK